MQPAINILDDSDGDEGVQYLTDEGTRLKLPEVILVEDLGVEILVKSSSLCMNLAAIPD